MSAPTTPPTIVHVEYLFCFDQNFEPRVPDFEPASAVTTPPSHLMWNPETDPWLYVPEAVFAVLRPSRLISTATEDQAGLAPGTADTIESRPGVHSVFGGHGSYQCLFSKSPPEAVSSAENYIFSDLVRFLLLMFVSHTFHRQSSSVSFLIGTRVSRNRLA